MENPGSNEDSGGGGLPESVKYRLQKMVGRDSNQPPRNRRLKYQNSDGILDGYGLRLGWARWSWRRTKGIGLCQRESDR